MRLASPLSNTTHYLLAHMLLQRSAALPCGHQMVNEVLSVLDVFLLHVSHLMKDQVGQVRSLILVEVQIFRSIVNGALDSTLELRIGIVEAPQQSLRLVGLRNVVTVLRPKLHFYLRKLANSMVLLLPQLSVEAPPLKTDLEQREDRHEEQDSNNGSSADSKASCAGPLDYVAQLLVARANLAFLKSDRLEDVGCGHVVV
mmetsp:Transcript_1163/g.1287  ORF Transcript_1163/g.1287 Transcript_1163/m.1287 type:complete len:200 (+) Transcript_1163:3-602(+)